MTLIIPSASSCLSPVTYEDEDEAAFEKDIVDHYRLFFGEKTLFIPKRKISGGALGNTIPDGFLFDCSNSQNPRFYIIEVELSHHSFHRHIRDQIEKFLGFFNESDIIRLVQAIYDTVNNDNELKQKWNSYCTGDMHHLMMRSIQGHHGILVLFEKKNDDLEAKFDKLGETHSKWKQKVQRIFIQKYQNDEEVFFHQEGGIGGQEASIIRDSVRKRASSHSHSTKTEEEHLRVCSPSTRETYEKIKEMLLANGLDQRIVGSYIGFRTKDGLAVSIYILKKFLSVYVHHENYRYRDGSQEKLPDVEQKKARIEGMVKSYRVEEPNRGHFYFYLRVTDADHMDELLAYMNPVLS